MGGFADQRDAVAAEGLWTLDGEGEQVAPGLDAHASKDRMRLLLDRGGQLRVAQAAKPLCFSRRRDPDDAGAVAGQGHEHARAMWRVELGRDIAMRPCVADV